MHGLLRAARACAASQANRLKWCFRRIENEVEAFYIGVDEMKNVMHAAVTASIIVLGSYNFAVAKPVSASARNQTVGTLECDAAEYIGMVLGSSRSLTCSFTHNDGGIEQYTGTIKKLGLDVGITKKPN
nr:DUF992 domain-containing protein [Ochrobactrum sp. LM19]